MHDDAGRPRLERIGDNAVDIGEQTAFVVTGLFREFSDSSRRRSPAPIRSSAPSSRAAFRGAVNSCE